MPPKIEPVELNDDTFDNKRHSGTKLKMDYRDDHRGKKEERNSHFDAGLNRHFNHHEDDELSILDMLTKDDNSNNAAAPRNLND